MYTDSHCHFIYLGYNTESEKIDLLNDMAQANITRAMSIMCQMNEYNEIFTWVDLAAQSDHYPDIGISIGVHPCQDLRQLQSASVDALLAQASHKKVWALGETGLDYYHDSDKKQVQKQSFAAHIQAGKLSQKPIIVHTRAAARDTLDMLKAEHCNHGIIHCFTEDYAFARTALDLGLYISLSGIISFKKAQNLQDVVKKLPLDRLLIETDSPYLAPTPKRGKPNSPAYVPFVAKALGDLFGKSAEEIGAITTKNFNDVVQLA